MDLEHLSKEKGETYYKSQKWTIQQTTKRFKAWKVLKLFVCLITTLLYPYYNVNGFPQIGSKSFWYLVFLEGVFAFEIIMNFFLQDIDEQGCSTNYSLETISQNYLRGRFLIDLITFLPLGAMFTNIDKRTKVLWLVKAIRIKELLSIL